MRVLVVNHTSAVSGGERSLLELLRAGTGDLEMVVACPEGPLAAAVRELRVPWRPLTGTAGSLRLHPRHTPSALLELARAAAEIRQVARAERTDLLHANTFRAGLAAAVAAAIVRRPLVTHAHDVLPPGRASRAVIRLLDAGTTLWAANSLHTERSLRALGARTPSRVVLNPVDLDRFDSAAVDRAASRRAVGLPAEVPVIAVVGQITPWKGQDVAIEVVGGLRERFPDLHLVIAGSTKFVEAATRFDNRAYLRGLEAAVENAGLADRVTFLGEREDVPRVMGAADAVLVPSWDEPFGLVVIEAMALGVPVIATAVGGPAEVITDGQDGLLCPPRDTAAWAEAVSRLLGSEPLRREMGERGARRAREGYGAAAYAERVRAAYGAAMGG